MDGTVPNLTMGRPVLEAGISPILKRRLYVGASKSISPCLANQHAWLMTPSEVRPAAVPPPHLLRCGLLASKAACVTDAYTSWNLVPL